MKQNPYSLLFGKEPIQKISRTMEIDTIYSMFTQEIPAQQVYMIIGVRGCGKTVLMTELSKKIARNDDWIVIELNPERDMLRDFAEKLNSNRVIAEIFRRAKINLSFLGIGLDISGEPPVTNIETALEQMLQSLKKKGKRILVTVDEAVNSPAMKEFAHTFQILIRQDLPLFLLMTGLYENINALQNEKSLTFLYRAPKITLEPLSIRAIAGQYRNVFQIDEEEAKKMAELTRGYSYAYQVLGYLTWENGGSWKDALFEYREYLADYSYDKIWAELSREDQRIVNGIANTASGKISEIRAYLDMDTNHFNPYRRRLIKKGIVNGEQYGYLKFVLPFFGEYALENYLD